MIEQFALFDASEFLLPPDWVLGPGGQEVCWFCRRPRTPAGDDPCIARLPHVSSACCGHGCDPEAPYGPYLIYMPPRRFYWVRLEGAQALAKMRELGGRPPTAEGAEPGG